MTPNNTYPIQRQKPRGGWVNDSIVSGEFAARRALSRLRKANPGTNFKCPRLDRS